MNPTLFLDRDGTINKDMIGDYVRSPEQFELIPGVAKALTEAKAAGFKLAIITNQQGIGKGYFTEKDLFAVHHKMQELTGIQFDEIQFSPFLKEANSPCRKPGTLMVERASKKLASDMKRSFYIGDKDADLLCAFRAGLPSILVLTGYGKETLDQVKTWTEAQPCFIARDLSEAVEFAITNTFNK